MATDKQTLGRMLRDVAESKKNRIEQFDGPLVAKVLVEVINRLQADPGVRVDFSDLTASPE